MLVPDVKSDTFTFLSKLLVIACLKVSSLCVEVTRQFGSVLGLQPFHRLLLTSVNALTQLTPILGHELTLAFLLRQRKRPLFSSYILFFIPVLRCVVYTLHCSFKGLTWAKLKVDRGRKASPLTLLTTLSPSPLLRRPIKLANLHLT